MKITPSVLPKHGPIEALLFFVVGPGVIAFRAPEARPH